MRKKTKTREEIIGGTKRMVQGYPFSGTVASPDSPPSPPYAVRIEVSERQVGWKRVTSTVKFEKGKWGRRHTRCRLLWPPSSPMAAAGSSEDAGEGKWIGWEGRRGCSGDLLGLKREEVSFICVFIYILEKIPLSTQLLTLNYTSSPEDLHITLYLFSLHNVIKFSQYFS